VTNRQLKKKFYGQENVLNLVKMTRKN